MDERSNFLEKVKKDPMTPLGVCGLIGVVTYAVYNFKKRGSKPVSIYLIHTRLAAQGTVIGCMTLGMVYSIYAKLQNKFSKKEESSST